jgi:hypothetical protein
VLVIVVVVPFAVSGADAVMLVAPSESMAAGFKVTEALPWESVNAVAVGVNTTIPLSAVKVTIAFCNRCPSASLRVAVAVTGAPHATILEVTPKVRELRSVVP